MTVACNESDVLQDSLGKSFALCKHSFLEGGCTVKGLSFRRSNFPQKIVDMHKKQEGMFLKIIKDDNADDESNQFVMGMCACCKQVQNGDHAKDGDEDSTMMRDCAVACSISSSPGDEPRILPYITVFNSSGDFTENVHAFGITAGLSNPQTLERPKGEVLPLWHMKLYRTAIKNRKLQDAAAKHRTVTDTKPKWRFLHRLGLGKITAYAVSLPNGSMDLVVVRSKVSASNVSRNATTDFGMPGGSGISLSRAFSSSCAVDNDHAITDNEDVDEHEDDGQHGFGESYHHQGITSKQQPYRGASGAIAAQQPARSVFSTTRAYSSWFRPMARGGD
jgi:hypothetical protein